MRVWAATCIAVLVIVIAAGTAMATPSTIIWIPSTDVQPFLVGHLGIDNYFRAARNSTGGRDPNTMDIGFTIGVLPFEKVQLELGFDYLVVAGNPNDQHPWSGNIKLGTPEDSLFKFSPAIAVGLYNARPVKDIQVKDRPFVTSGQNIVYGLVARTVPAFASVPSLGRFSIGYYRGAARTLVDNPDLTVAKSANTGLLFSWDRTLSEISDKLWLGVDYMGGDNVDGSWNVGLAWKFASNVSLIFGYDMYTRKSLAGENTFTAQLDIDFP